jgi:hypothetical protein
MTVDEAKALQEKSNQAGRLCTEISTLTMMIDTGKESKDVLLDVRLASKSWVWAGGCSSPELGSMLKEAILHVLETRLKHVQKELAKL